MGIQVNKISNNSVNCGVCGAVAQNVMEKQLEEGLSVFYECTNCGCLINKYYSDVHLFEHYFDETTSCRDTFLCFKITKILSELLKEKSICVISADMSAGFLTRMLLDAGYNAVALRYIEEGQFIGVDHHDSSHRPPHDIDDVNQKIIVVLGTLQFLKEPLAFFKAIKNLQPRCLVTVNDIYQGQDLSWHALLKPTRYNRLFFSHQAMHLFGQETDLLVHSSENLYVLSSDSIGNSENQITKLLASYSYLGGNDFADYLAMVKIRSLTAENDARQNTASNKRIYLAAPVSNHLYIDCIFYQMANSGIARVWNDVFRVWSKKHADKVVLLDRGGDIQDFGLQRIPFKRFNFSDINTEIRALSWFLLRKGTFRFASTYYTFSESHPTRAVAYDMLPENLNSDLNDPQWVLKKMYLARAESALSISKNTMNDVVKYYPHLINTSRYTYPGVSPIFKPITIPEKENFRNAYAITSRLLITIPCALSGYKDGLTALRAIDKMDIASDTEVICTVPLYGQEKVLESLQRVKVRFMRFSDQDYATLIASSDLVVWTPWLEGLGLPPLEALACHTNIVVSRTNINVELYGDLAIYAEAGNVDSFCYAIKHALSNKVDNRLIDLASSYSSIEVFADNLFDHLYS